MREWFLSSKSGPQHFVFALNFYSIHLAAIACLLHIARTKPPALINYRPGRLSVPFTSQESTIYRTPCIPFADVRRTYEVSITGGKFPLASV